MNEEHNMTLREKFSIAFGLTIKFDDAHRATHYSIKSKDVTDFFLAQFDAMLAEDIEKIESYYLPNHEAYEESLNATRILEARRLSLKK